MLNYKDIGKRIKAERTKQGLSQIQLAEKASLSVTHVSHIETGNTKLSLPALVKLSTALQVSVEFLLRDQEILSKKIQSNVIAETLEQCTDAQIRVIADVVVATKNSMDKNL